MAELMQTATEANVELAIKVVGLNAQAQVQANQQSIANQVLDMYV